MRVLGCPDYSYSKELLNTVNSSNYFSQVNSNSLYHGIDWVYTTITTTQFYNFKIWYFWFSDSIFDVSYDYFFNVYWGFLITTISSFNLFWSVVLDNYVLTTIFKLPFLDDWFRGILSSYETSLVFIYHPELVIVKDLVNKDFFFNYLSNITFSIFDLTSVEQYYNPILLVPQLLALVFIAFLFLNFYFSYYTSANNEESTIDSDYLISNITVEAEKEISSFDDMILGFVILIYVFGWYFYIHCWSMLSMLPELILVFYLFPWLFYIILGVPTSLIYNFGIYFLSYMNGVAKGSVLAVSLMFDYIAVIIFYVRILVQSVRLLLMLGTYIGMQDVVLYFTFSQKLFIMSDTIWENLSIPSITLNGFSYFILFTLPGIFVHWIYEILHTYFVVTVQFAAFFAIVFWLYLFLYTFFVIEKQENYLTSKRIMRSNYFNYLKY